MNGRTITAQQMRDLACALVGPTTSPCSAFVFGGRREVRVYVDGTPKILFQSSRANLLLLAKYRGLV